MCNYQIGDRVMIINNLKTYPTFDKMFELLGFKDKVINELWKNGEIGVIFDITKHPSYDDRTLIALRHDDGRECLINIEGINFFGRKPFKLKRNV